MKRIVRGVRALNERAAELTAAAGQLPNRVAELREAMAATGGQLQSLRDGIQVNVGDLLVDREDQLGDALVELAAHAPVFAEAGFLLDGLDVEISPVQRLIVQLVRVREVDTLAVQAMVQRHQQQKSVRAILSAIVKARAMVETVEIEGLDYHKLTIGIGPVPTIRLCWRGCQHSQPVAGSAPGPPPARPSAPTTASFFSGSPWASPDGSFFGPPTGIAPAPEEEPTAPEEEPTAPEEEPTAPEEEPTVTARPPMPGSRAAAKSRPAVPPPMPDPAGDPLARFKVMPDYRRGRRS